MGARQTGVPLGGLLAAALLPSIAAASSWRVALVAAGLLTGLGAVCVLAMTRGRDDSGPPPAARQEPHEHPWRDLGIVLLTVWGCLVVSGQYALISSLALDIHKASGRSLTQTSLLVVAAQVGGIAGRIGWGVLSDHDAAQRREPFLFVMNLLAIGVALAFFAGPVRASFSALRCVAAVAGSALIGWQRRWVTAVAERAGPSHAARPSASPSPSSALRARRLPRSTASSATSAEGCGRSGLPSRWHSPLRSSQSSCAATRLAREQVAGRSGLADAPRAGRESSSLAGQRVSGPSAAAEPSLGASSTPARHQASSTQIAREGTASSRHVGAAASGRGGSVRATVRIRHWRNSTVLSRLREAEGSLVDAVERLDERVDGRCVEFEIGHGNVELPDLAGVTRLGGPMQLPIRLRPSRPVEERVPRPDVLLEQLVHGHALEDVGPREEPDENSCSTSATSAPQALSVPAWRGISTLVMRSSSAIAAT
jgi:hypothetical protein